MKLASVVAVVALVAVAQAASADHPLRADFAAWRREHGKTYESAAEEEARFDVYIANEALIAEWNADPEDGAEYGHSEFSDLTPEEFESQVLGAAVPDYPLSEARPEARLGSTPASQLSEEAWDWREHGAVLDAPDEGWCGAAFAFAAAGAVEGAVAVETGSLAPVSAMQGLMCAENTCGCFGGWPHDVYEHWKNTGILSNEAYPYTAYPVGQCMPCPVDPDCPDPGLCDCTCEEEGVSDEPVLALEGWETLPEDEAVVAETLVARGPVAATMNGARLSFYKRGVSKPKACSKKNLNTSVLIVGYGETSTKHNPYWIARWSRGPKWGEHGTFRMYRAQGDNRCGIVSAVEVPTVSAYSQE